MRKINPSSHTMLKIVFLNKIFAYNPGTISPEKTGKKIKKTTSGVYVPVLNVSKWTPKFSKKKTMLHIVPRTGCPEKKKSEIRPGYYLRGLPVKLKL